MGKAAAAGYKQPFWASQWEEGRGAPRTCERVHFDKLLLIQRLLLLSIVSPPVGAALRL